MAEEDAEDSGDSGDAVLWKTFGITMIGAALFIGTVFLFII